MSFTLKDLIENPDQRFWECDEVEHDPVMVELVARAKANPERDGQSAFIERARKLMYDAINKRVEGADMITSRDAFYRSRASFFYHSADNVRRYRAVCTKCGRKIPIPILVPVSKHADLLSRMPSCTACGAPDSWTVEEVK